jgi:anti-anti-sigma factor
MKIQSRQRGNVLVFDVFGEMDLNEARNMKTMFQEKLDEGFRLIAINLQGVPYVDSMGFGVLISCMRSLASVQGRMVLFGMNPAVEKIFKLTHLDRIISSVGDEQQSLEFLTKQP